MILIVLYRLVGTSKPETKLKFFISGEFDKWLTEEQFDSQCTSEVDYDQPYVNLTFHLFTDSNHLITRYSMQDENGQMILTHRGSGSGGYLDYVFRSTAKEVFNIDTDDKPLEFKNDKV